VAQRARACLRIRPVTQRGLPHGDTGRHASEAVPALTGPGKQNSNWLLLRACHTYGIQENDVKKKLYLMWQFLFASNKYPPDYTIRQVLRKSMQKNAYPYYLLFLLALSQ